MDEQPNTNDSDYYNQYTEDLKQTLGSGVDISSIITGAKFKNIYLELQNENDPASYLDDLKSELQSIAKQYNIGEKDLEAILGQIRGAIENNISQITDDSILIDRINNALNRFFNADAKDDFSSKSA